MIEISCKETLYTYNAYHIVKTFFPEAVIKQHVDAEQEPLVRLVLDGGFCFSIVEDADSAAQEDPQEKKKRVTRRIYRYLTEYTHRTPAWGMLTGVRPTKLAMKGLEKGRSEEEIVDFLQKEYAVSEAKSRLAVEIAVREKEILRPLDMQEGFSLYVGIPFCPSICSYCSFSSSPAELWRERMESYVDALCREIAAITGMHAGKKLDTIYIGGGTPTTLSAEQLERVLSQIEETGRVFGGAGQLLEYTVEAGRPDSITREKLEVLRRHPVTRISINPQTMQQKTLDLVGRRHTVQDVKTCISLARELGFDNINMDLIAGLPGESPHDMQDTLRQVEMLAPDSLTVHSLAIKRAARMGQEQKNGLRAETSAGVRRQGSADLQIGISQMIEDSAEAAERIGLVPYYLYRQKNIAGNFENVGYTRAGKAGIYNILIMEEKQSIIACGAGSVSKRVYPDGRIERCENVKDVSQYIERIGEMIERKRVLLEDQQFKI